MYAWCLYITIIWVQRCHKYQTNNKCTYLIYICIILSTVYPLKIVARGRWLVQQTGAGLLGQIPFFKSSECNIVNSNRQIWSFKGSNMSVASSYEKHCIPLCLRKGMHFVFINSFLYFNYFDLSWNKKLDCVPTALIVLRLITQFMSLATGYQKQEDQ